MSAKNQNTTSTTLESKSDLSKDTPSAKEENKEDTSKKD